MPTYVFVLINHLGEPFEASELNFEDDQQAKAYAASLFVGTRNSERLDARFMTPFDAH